MPLTDTAIRGAKPTAKPVKMFHAGGLLLLVQPRGFKRWRFKYRIAGYSGGNIASTASRVRRCHLRIFQ